jgi:hypothetical protein
MFDWLKSGTAPEPRNGMPSPRLDEGEFKRRFRDQFHDPSFDALASELDRIAHGAWEAYADSRKAPRTRKAGPGFSDPDYDLSLDWIDTAEALKAATRHHANPAGPSRILLINGSSRSEHTCPVKCQKHSVSPRSLGKP